MTFPEFTELIEHKDLIRMVNRNTSHLVIVVFYYYVWIGIYSVWLVAIDTYP